MTQVGFGRDCVGSKGNLQQVFQNIVEIGILSILNSYCSEK